MSTLKEDIKSQSDWIVKAFKADGLKLDYTINSFKNLDKFFDKHAINGKAKKGGRLEGSLGPIIFSIGAYMGETLIKTFPGSVWVTDDKDPEGELNVELHLSGGSVIWPTQRAFKRFQNGVEDGLFVYGSSIARELGVGISTEVEKNKPWWKFW